MKGDAQEKERLAQAEFRRYAASQSGWAFVRWLEARCERRMQDAANASRESFEKRQGAFLELKAMLGELRSDIEP